MSGSDTKNPKTDNKVRLCRDALLNKDLLAAPAKNWLHNSCEGSIVQCEAYVKTGLG